ncbi:MAG: DegT/DnrJ/EryC1/StrS family aminotransferase [Candidatus Aminicenantes bacterium]|nr:DegT/DnrJ/EryC1/StrS family aminotransferase [Candidatus Aminicenantes bacterium]
MNIPFLDLKKQYREYEKEILDRLPGFLADQKFILGEEVRLLENEVAAACGTDFGVGVSSGSDALIISLMALGIQRGDCVVTTPFTFFATAGAISRLGAVPLFCDIDPVTYNLSPERLDDLLTAEIEDHGNTRIKAVIPVHLYGQCCDMYDILALTDKYNLSVIEDAAQAIGTEYATAEGIKQACGMGTCGILSFFPSKNLGAFGDGGMVLTNDRALAEKLRLLRVHGSTNKYFYETLGGNFRLDALQAMILRVKLKHLDGWIAGRMEKAAYYDRRFQESGLTDKGIQPPAAIFKGCGGNRHHTYHQYVIRASRRDDLQAFLTDRGIASAIYYPLCLHQQKCFADLGYSTGDFPESEKASGEVLALPIYGEMTEDQQEFIIGTIEGFYG